MGSLSNGYEAEGRELSSAAKGIERSRGGKKSGKKKTHFTSCDRHVHLARMLL